MLDPRGAAAVFVSVLNMLLVSQTHLIRVFGLISLMYKGRRLHSKSLTLRPFVLHLSVSPAVRRAFVFDPQVQFQKIQQLRLSQTRAPYYGGSLPNVNQIGNTSTEFQVGAHHRPPHTASS